MIEAPGRKEIWSEVTLYSSVERCVLEWKLLSGKIDADDGTDDDVPDMDLWQFLLQRDTGLTQDAGVVDHGVVNVWGNLKSELMRAQRVVLTTVEEMLVLSRDPLASRDEIRKLLTVTEEKVAQSIGEREIFDVKILDANLNLALM